MTARRALEEAVTLLAVALVAVVVA